MFLSFKEVGSNSIIRVALDKILYYQPSPHTPDVTYIFLQQDTMLKVASKSEDVDKQISFIMGIKDINGHLIRSV